MRITVAICTWNRCELLAQTLEQMTRLRVAADVDWELLIVNNNCTDATDAVLESQSTRLPIRRLFEPRPGKSGALNLTLREAKGDFIVWTDDDVLVDEAWLEGLVETARRYPTATVFGGPIEPLFPVAPDPALIAAFPSLGRGFCGVDHLQGEGPLDEGLYVRGANMACRKAGIGHLTFAERLGPLESWGRVGEDSEFVDRVRQRGGELVWSPRMRVRHYVPASRTTLEKPHQARRGSWPDVGSYDGYSRGPRVLGAPRWGGNTSRPTLGTCAIASRRTGRLVWCSCDGSATGAARSASAA